MSLHEVEPRAAAIREAQVAISCLFLDTELAKGDLAALAKVLKSTGLPPAELQRIYETEVAPACWRNLWVPAGVWDGFEEEWLMSAIERHRLPASPPRSFFQRLRIRFWTARTRDEWARVMQMCTGA
jgi:hypothetical protein